MGTPKKRFEVNFFGISFRLFLAALFMSAVFYLAGPLYVRLFLPLFSFEIKQIHPEYKVKRIYLNEKKEIWYDIVLPLKFVNAEGRTIRTDIPLRGAILGKTMYICPIIIYALILGWPGLSAKQRIKSIGVSIPLLIATQLVDIPIHLINRVEMSLVSLQINPTVKTFREFWFYLMNNGGRQFLAVLVAMLSIAAVRMVFPKATRYDQKVIGRNDPCPCGSGKKYKKCCG